MKVGDDVRNLQNLLDGRIDGFIADRIVAKPQASKASLSRNCSGLAIAFSLYLGWEAERLHPGKIWLGVVVTIAGAFLTRMAAVAFGLKGWSYV